VQDFAKAEPPVKAAIARVFLSSESSRALSLDLDHAPEGRKTSTPVPPEAIRPRRAEIQGLAPHEHWAASQKRMKEAILSHDHEELFLRTDLTKSRGRLIGLVGSVFSVTNRRRDHSPGRRS
jgi:hypothetical protein